VADALRERNVAIGVAMREAGVGVPLAALGGWSR
jgi:hypothetical protein